MSGAVVLVCESLCELELVDELESAHRDKSVF